MDCYRHNGIESTSNETWAELILHTIQLSYFHALILFHKCFLPLCVVRPTIHRRSAVFKFTVDFFIMDHFMVKSVLFCFKCQTCFESSVSFEHFLCVKDLIWLLYRSLNVFEVMPM